MATHHVGLRRFCPNPFGQLTASPGECDLRMNPTQAQRTSFKVRYCFYPWERFTTERPNSIENWQGACVRPRYSPSRARKRQSNRIGAIPMAKARGLRAKGVGQQPPSEIVPAALGGGTILAPTSESQDQHAHECLQIKAWVAATKCASKWGKAALPGY
jgi:hypothetical protein